MFKKPSHKSNEQPGVSVGKTILKHPGKKAALLIALGLLLLASGLFYALNNRQNNPGPGKNGDEIVFRIESKDYTKNEIKPYIAFITVALGKKDEEANKEVFELMKYKATKEKLGISLTPQQTNYEQKQLNRTYTKISKAWGYKKWSGLTAEKLALDKAFATSRAGDNNYKGYSFVFWFANHLSYTGDYTPPGGYGDHKLIQQDRDYAKQRADYYHEQLANNKMTADEVLSAIKTDKKLGFQYSAGANFSTKYGYDPNKSWQQEVLYKSVADHIKQYSNQALSNVKTGKTMIFRSASADSEETETFYFFVKSEGQNITKQRFQDELKNLDTKYYGEKQ